MFFLAHSVVTKRLLLWRGMRDLWNGFITVKMPFLSVCHPTNDVTAVTGNC